MNYLLTDAGAELLAKLGATGTGLRLACARTGEGYSDDPESMTELLESQLEFQIADARRENAAVVLTLPVTNSGLTDEHRIQQIGIFALDEETGGEVLLIIGQDLNGDILPADSYGRGEYRYTVTIKISNAMNVVIDINDTDFLLQKTFYECYSEGNIAEAFYKVYAKVPKEEEAGTDAKAGI